MSDKILISIAHPQDVALAVPPLVEGRSGVNLRQIAQGYSGYVPDWARAANAEYRDSANGRAIGLLACWGTVYAAYPITGWPALYRRGNRAWIGPANVSTAKTADWAIGAGPQLVRGGMLTDLGAEIRAGSFTGLREASPAERAGIGIRVDGAIVHVAMASATLSHLATVLAAAGCVDAIALDGGGSVGVVDREGQVLLGHASRDVCSALMMHRLVPLIGNEQPKDDEPPKARSPIVCLDPGHGGRDRSNRGSAGYIEADGVLDITLTAGQVLRSHGIDVRYTRTEDRDLAGKQYTQHEDLAHRAGVANAAKADLFVSIHSNAGGGHGTETYHFLGSARGRTLATAIQQKLVAELGRADRGVKSSNFAVLRLTTMPAALAEVAFHDSAEEEQLLLRPEFRARAGYAIAMGIILCLPQNEGGTW